MKSSNKLFFIILVLVHFLPSCSNSKIENENEKSNSKAKNNDNLLVENELVNPIDTNALAKFILPGFYHSDEFSKKDKNENCFGIFKNKKECYLAETKIKTHRYFDEIVDEDSLHPTGWEITTLNKDTCLALISNLDYLENKSIEQIDLSQKKLYGKKPIFFKYNEIEYQLFSTGKRTVDPESPDYVEITDFKLYFSAKIGGKEIKELIVEQDNFNLDNGLRIIFAGDIDGDGKLDLIVDCSDHYNVSNPVLFLSRPAGKNHLLKKVGEHRSVGC